MKIFFYLSICRIVLAAVELTPVQWVELKSWAGAVAQRPLSQAEGVLLEQCLKIDMQFDEIRNIYKKYKVIQLRPKKFSKLLVGYDNMTDCTYADWDTVDADGMQNPTYIANMGDPGFSAFMQASEQSYRVIRLGSMADISSLGLQNVEKRHLLMRQIKKMIENGGHFESDRSRLLLKEKGESGIVDNFDWSSMFSPDEFQAFRAAFAKIVAGLLAKKPCVTLIDNEISEISEAPTEQEVFKAISTMPFVQRARQMFIDQLASEARAYGLDVEIDETMQDILMKRSVAADHQYCRDRGENFDFLDLRYIIFDYGPVKFRSNSKAE